MRSYPKLYVLLSEYENMTRISWVDLEPDELDTNPIKLFLLDRNASNPYFFSGQPSGPNLNR